MGLGVVLEGRQGGTEPLRTEEEDGSKKLFFHFFLGILFYFKLVEGKF